MEKKQILVAGGTGLLGSSLTFYYLEIKSFY